MRKAQKSHFRDSEFLSKVGKRIEEFMIEKNITHEMARESWGEPNDINRTVGSWGVREQWIYGDILNAKYLYFKNGRLTSWQE